MSRFAFFAALCAALHSLPLSAHPEYQTFVVNTSGRAVDCGLCHAHPEGPEGLKPGQIGSLTPEQLTQLNRARAAFEPGANVENPLLNAFGNHILNTLGKRQILLLRQHPEQLPALLGNDSDLDGDGVPDAEEYLKGTHPLNPHHGPPARLFVLNLQKYRFDLIMIAVATALGLYGLNHLRQWLHQTLPASKEPPNS